MKKELNLQNLKQAVSESFIEFTDTKIGKIAMCSPALALTTSPAFADPSSGSIVTGEMLQPIVAIITSNITAILPVGLTIMGAVIGVGMIPRIIYKFL